MCTQIMRTIDSRDGATEPNKVFFSTKLSSDTKLSKSMKTSFYTSRDVEL